MSDYLKFILHTRDKDGNIISSYEGPSNPKDPKAHLVDDVVTKHDSNGRIIDVGMKRSDGTIKWSKK